MKNKLKAKAILSSVLLACILLIAITGIMLHFCPYGVIAGIPRLYVKDFHAVMSIIMTCGIVIHFILNIKLYAKELRTLKGSKKDDTNNEDE